MIFILIVLFSGYGPSQSGKAALAVEFNDLPSCRSAAAEIRRQTDSVYVALCAQKGVAK